MSVTEEKFSLKLEETASQPKHRGAYYPEDAAQKGLALVQAKHADSKLYWLVDPQEDRVYSARFFAYGGKLSIAIGETLCALVKGLTVPEACSLLGSDVEQALRDDADSPAVPESRLPAFDAVNKMLGIIQQEYPAAKAVALASKTIKDKEGEDGSAIKVLSLMEQAWLGLTEAEQIQQVNIVLDEKVRPALRSDGGDALVKKIVDGRKIIIQYVGACGSCGSSVGATLSFIEQTLRNHIYNDLAVIPDTYADMV
jgi:NifU-like protein